ncbi:hypothetical protein [Niastella yeongjuensis]|uniref:hypothetical protein n=1 Tax=Niastella yeongjuensis TaxID=354355 RepID=UPI0015A70687|nr:hypothetical protein [Niastella yeongjuensis]
MQHWLQAARRMATIDHLASGNAWHGIDRNLANKIRTALQHSSNEVVQLGTVLKRQLEQSAEPEVLRAVKRGLLQLRERYLKTEETIHFYTIAINSRTTPTIAALLRACDIICQKSMQELLQPLGKEIPDVLTYVDKGVGASILKAGLRLWDGRLSPVAAIKITQHNLFRPTAIIHETGHQIADLLDWNRELANAFRTQLTTHPAAVGLAFSAWASEIAADAFAFVHTGFAAVASLNDVVSGTPEAVFAFRAHDPHPIAYLRVLMNVEMCRQFYGRGPWDDLEAAFKNDYDLNLVNFPSAGLIKMCVPALPDVVTVLLKSGYNAFNGQSLSQLIPPARVSPQALERLEYVAGPALFTSHAWIWKECIRLLAINGYKIGAVKGDIEALYRQQQDWMQQLGFSIELN